MKNFSRPSFARCYQAIPEIWRGGWTQRGSLHQVTRTLTNAETLALPTATIELAPAATGILTMPIALVFRADTAAGAYTNVDAAFELELRTNATKITNIDVTASRALVLAAAIHTWFIASVLDTTLTEGLDTAFMNRAINLAATNAAAGNLTGGNAANTLRVTLAYLRYLPSGTLA